MNKQNNERGFTLIEVIAAITIISILMISIFQFLQQSMTASKDNENRTLALYVGNGVMNYMRNQEYHLIKAFYEDKKTENSVVVITPYQNESFYDVTYTVDDMRDYRLFSDADVCQSIFQPTLNNVTYKENIHVFITDHFSADYIQSLTHYFSSNNLHVSSNDLNGLLATADSDYESIGFLYYVVFVDLNVADRRNGILLEGSIRDE